MGMKDAKEQFSIVVLKMAQSKASLKDRILNAYLKFHLVKPEDLPEGCEKKYKRLMDTLTREEAIGNEGNLVATLNKMSEQELKDIIEEICSISREIDRTYAD